jgi:hypothetical protein
VDLWAGMGQAGSLIRVYLVSIDTLSHSKWASVSWVELHSFPVLLKGPGTTTSSTSKSQVQDAVDTRGKKPKWDGLRL